MARHWGDVFWGSRINCASCHTQLPDPITHTDYHAIAAVFSGVRHGERALKPTDHNQRMTKAKLLGRLSGRQLRVERRVARCQLLSVPIDDERFCRPLGFAPSASALAITTRMSSGCSFSTHSRRHSISASLLQRSRLRRYLGRLLGPIQSFEVAAFTQHARASR